jgi:response regulator RpfG family c-di-GMP phosphodiesterase
MKQSLTIICLEDEPEVLEAILRDLAPFEERFRIEPAASANEAREIITALEKEDGLLALILCDHVMPGESGIAFLTSLNDSQSPALENARKILLTGQAGHEDTIDAINEGGIHYYLTKPWDPEKLLATVREQLTRYVILRNIDPLPYMQLLDAQALAEHMHDKNPFSEG